MAAYRPFRIGIVRFRRGSVARGICVLVVKAATRAFRGRLSARLTEIRPIDRASLVFRSTDSMVMDAVYWSGVQGYEGIVATIWATLCRRAQSVVEVGGNVGLFTVIGANASSASYTVLEPVPRNVAVLRENLALNGLNRVEVLHAAAIPGAAPAEVTLSIPDEGRDAPVGAHLTEGVEVEGRSSANRIRVAGLPFRDLLAGRDLLKIDAEGIEAELLESARDIILAHRPTMVVEVLPEATRLAGLIAELATTAGYLIHVVPEWGSETIVTVAARDFTASSPGQYHSKDVVLSMTPILA